MKTVRFTESETDTNIYHLQIGRTWDGKEQKLYKWFRTSP